MLPAYFFHLDDYVFNLVDTIFQTLLHQHANVIVILLKHKQRFVLNLVCVIQIRHKSELLLINLFEFISLILN